MPQSPYSRAAKLTERDHLANEALASRYDALNQMFTVVEQHLRNLKPVFPVWVSYDHDETGQFYEVLGLTKHQGKWRLCHGNDDELNPGGPNNVTPIVECPVEIRVRAASQVEALHEKIVKEKEDYIPQVDKAIKTLADLLDRQRKAVAK